MGKKIISSTEDVRVQQEQKVKDFTTEYYALCEKYHLQIVQSPLSIVDYVKPEPTINETKTSIAS